MLNDKTTNTINSFRLYIHETFITVSTFWVYLSSGPMDTRTKTLTGVLLIET